MINVKVAQVTGKITTCKGLCRHQLKCSIDVALDFYGNAALTRTELVNKIQETLQSLHDIERSKPIVLSIAFTDSPSAIARTSAFLYLMLFLASQLKRQPWHLSSPNSEL